MSQQKSAPLDEQTLEELYDTFSLRSWDLPRVMESFEMLKRKLKVEKLCGLELYKELKSKLSKIWKAKELLTLLDKRANQKEYMGQKASKNIRVLIIGAGPAGLRLAIDCVLLGAKVIVIEKRNTFSRNNVLHLWPFTIEDLRQLGAKKFYGKFCAGAIDHVSIRSLQCILLKTCLLMGVELHYNIEFLDVLEPEENGIGWHASVSPGDHPVSKFEFDFIVDAGGARRIRIPCFDRRELRGKLALAITANFKNYGTSQEAAVDEISGVAFIFNQKFFKELNAETGIDLENIVYYKDDTHYFVMTAKKDSLLKKGVLKADHSDATKLLQRDNIDEKNLCKYSTEAASWSTDLPKLDFVNNHYNKPDVALFDFTSIHQTEHAAKAIKKGDKVLYLCLVGDALLEPFWPQGTGCGRGFLGAMDTAWLIRGAGQGMPVMDLLCEREIIFQRLPQTTAQKLQKNTDAYTIDPRTRYRNLNLVRKLRSDVMERLYVMDETPSATMSVAAPEGTIVSKGASATQSSRQNLDKENIPVVPARTKKAKGKGTSSSSRKPLLEKGTVHRAYYVNIDDFNTLKTHRELKLWLKKQVEPCGIKVVDLSSSWSNGLALCALIHRYRPDLIPDFKKLSPEDSVENNQLAFSVAEKHLGISSLIKPTEMEKPDRLALVTYLSLFYELFQDSQPVTSQSGSGNTLEVSPIKAKPIATKEPTPSKEVKSSSEKSSILPKMSVTSTKKQDTHAEKPGRSIEKKATSTQKVAVSSLKPAAHISNKKEVEPAEKSDNQHVTVVEKQVASGSSESQFTTTEKSAEKVKTLTEKSAEKVKTLTEKSDASAKDQTASPVETPTKKKKKRKFHNIFRRKKKNKSLATATPLVERRWTTKERPKFTLRNSSKQKTPSLEVSSYSTKDEKVSSATGTTSTTPTPTKPRSLSLSEPGGQFKAKPLNSSDLCYFCGKRVYVMEKMSANGCYFHRNCFRCTHCNCQLQMGSYTFCKGKEEGEKGKFFCSAHYRQLFLSHPEVINYSRAGVVKNSSKKVEPTSDSSSKVVQDVQSAGMKKHDSPIQKEEIKEEDDDVFTGGDSEVTSKSKKKANKKSKEIPKPLKTQPSEATKSSESPKTPKSAKSKKTSWFRKRSSSDSKALKSKSADNGTSPSEFRSTPVSPENVEQSQAPRKSPSTTGGNSKGVVKRLSAHFEALDKQESGAEGRVKEAHSQFKQQLSVISEDTTQSVGRSASLSSSSRQPRSPVQEVPPTTRTPKRGQKNLTRPVVSSYSTSDVAIREYRKQQERFTEAHMIQREMSQLEIQREELEEDGRKMENAIRNITDSDQEDELMAQWVSLINERNGLEKLTAELTLKMRELELEDRQYEIEKELYELSQIPSDRLKSEEKKRFDDLCDQKFKVVMERNEIVEQLEEERVQNQTDEATDGGFEGEDELLLEGSPRSSCESSEDDSDLQEDP